MSHRSNPWNEGLARDLQEPDFARAFLLAAVEEGIPLRTALAKVIRAHGVNEFARRIRMASPNVLRALRPQANPTQDTLNRLLRPFGLELSVVPLRSRKGRRAA